MFTSINLVDSANIGVLSSVIVISPCNREQLNVSRSQLQVFCWHSFDYNHYNHAIPSVEL